MGRQNANKDLQAKIAGLKVLVIDDQQEVRALVRDVLAEAGISRILEAANGKEAMLFIDTDIAAVDLIICDWNMPGITGLDLLRQVRSVFPDMPFLMITGRSDKDSVVEAKMAGVSAFIRKPFSPEQLEAKLRTLSQRL